ncbi:phage tail tape measure protein [Paenibacillus sp. M1]|uniref:Phage tail tape measure protein n=1 Tax=Paenibacillus haidiansis TaxID=1574488 RepID=A0ABU7VVQ8_9BACL
MKNLKRYNQAMTELRKQTVTVYDLSGIAMMSKKMWEAGSASGMMNRKLADMREKAAAAAATVGTGFKKALKWAGQNVGDGAKAAGAKIANWRDGPKRVAFANAAYGMTGKSQNKPPRGIKKLRERAGVKPVQQLSENRKKQLSSAVSSAGSVLGSLKDTSLEAAKEFSTAIGTLRASSMAAPGQMEGMIQSLRELGGQVPQKLDEVAKVMGTLNGKAKLTGDGLKNMSKTVLDASRLSGANSAEAAESAAKVMLAWKKEAGDGILMMDQFFAASRQSGAGMGDLLKNMGQFGVPMQQMGLNFEQSMALMAKWQNEGLTPLQDAMQKDLRGEGIGFAAIAKQIKEAATETEAAKKAAAFFGERVSGDMVKALWQGKVELTGVVDAMGKARGAIQTQAGQVQTFGDKWDMLQNRIAIALAPVGELLLPVGLAIASAIEILTRNADIALAALGAVTIFLLGVYGPAMLASAAATLAAFWPIILIAVLIGAAVAGIAYLFKYHMDEIMGYVNAVTEELSSLFSFFDDDKTATVQVQGKAVNQATNNGGPPTSKYHGMDYVPYDGMVARLHKGERIMTASENREFSQGGGGGAGGPISITGNTFHVRQESDIDAIARALAREIKAAGGLMA